MKLKNQNILVTGGNGFLGRHVVSKLKRCGATNIFTPRSKEYNLLERSNCQSLINGVDLVIHLAAQVGGIGYINDHPGEMFYKNAVMGIELMEAARRAKVKKFVSIGTVCAYPNVLTLPFKEAYLWRGYPEDTTAPYGLAKKMLLVQGNAYRKQYGFNAIHLIPVNLYGPGDNFNRASAHVIPALIKKIIDARNKNKKSVEVWGSGSATREFLYVKDAAEGIVQATLKYQDVKPLNLGTGVETSIKEVVEIIMKLCNYKGSIRWNDNKPDGQPRRQLDVSRAKRIGFTAKTSLREGLKKTIEWYLEHL